MGSEPEVGALRSAQWYQTEMNEAIDKQAGAQIAGVNAGAGQAMVD